MISVLAAVAFWQQGRWMPAPATAVVYEVNLRAFSQAGDLASVTRNLPRLKSLGVNIVWLMPIYPVGKVKAVPPMGSPYAVANYDRVSPEFGSEADLKALVASAHAKSMAVILDWVGDHTAWDNPWIAHKDWYLRDSAGDPISPPGTGWADVAGLDFSSKPMRDAMIASMKRWIVKDGVDGFRCDAADRTPIDFWKDALADLRASVHRRLFFLAEGNRPDDFKAGFDAIYGWDFYHALIDVIGKGKPATELATWDAHERRGAKPGQEPLRFITNHDEWAFSGTPSKVFGGERAATAAFAIACFYGGIPMIYNGLEIGWDKPIGIFGRDPISWSRSSAQGDRVSEMANLRQLAGPFFLQDATDFSTSDIAAIKRVFGGSSLILLVNVRPTETHFQISHFRSLYPNFGWVGDFAGTVGPDGDITLEPYQVLLGRSADK
jgi:glycosidase